MKSKASKFCGGALAVMLALLCLAGPSSAKSLYVIASQDSEYTSRIQAYNVNADGTLTYQATYTPAGNSTVGLGLDNASNTLFVSTEASGYLTVIDAKTMTSLGAPAPGAYDLAGIVMDEGKQLLYTVRGTDQLYVYTWDATANPGPTLGGGDPTPPGPFNTSDWSPGTVRDSATLAALDAQPDALYRRQLRYPYLKQYNLTSGAINRVEITGVKASLRRQTWMRTPVTSISAPPT